MNNLTYRCVNRLIGPTRPDEVETLSARARALPRGDRPSPRFRENAQAMICRHRHHRR